MLLIVNMYRYKLLITYFYYYCDQKFVSSQYKVIHSTPHKQSTTGRSRCMYVPCRRFIRCSTRQRWHRVSALCVIIQYRKYSAPSGAFDPRARCHWTPRYGNWKRWCSLWSREYCRWHVHPGPIVPRAIVTGIVRPRFRITVSATWRRRTRVRFTGRNCGSRSTRRCGSRWCYSTGRDTIGNTRSATRC